MKWAYLKMPHFCVPEASGCGEASATSHKTNLFKHGEIRSALAWWPFLAGVTLCGGVRENERAFLFVWHPDSCSESNLSEKDLSAIKENKMRRKDAAVVMLASVLLLLLCQTGQAQLFDSPKSFPIGIKPVSVGTGDLDGDGILDLAVANSDSGGISVLLGKGDGTFSEALSYATGNQPSSLAIGDLNGDGILDLAVANTGYITTPYYTADGCVSVLLGNGDGTFRPAVNYGTGYGPTSLAIGDVNGDGALDLAVLNSGSRNVSVLLGNEDGTFHSAVNYPAGDGPTSLAIGDLNGDGILDLVVTQAVTCNVSVLLGNGDGTFQGAAETARFFCSLDVITVGDLNGDGVLDLVVTGHTIPVSPSRETSSRFLKGELGNGDGTFRAVNYPAGDGPSSVAIGDLNGDGALDLAVANSGSDNVSVLLGNGDGTFGIAGNYPAGDGPSSIAIGDLNGDGALDLAVANSGSSDVSVLINTGSSNGGGDGSSSNGGGGGCFIATAAYESGTSKEILAVVIFVGVSMVGLLALRQRRRKRNYPPFHDGDV